MNAVSHIPMRFTAPLLFALTTTGATAQCGGVRPAFEWRSEVGLMYFTDLTDHGFQWPDSISWNSNAGIHTQGTSIVHLYPTAGIDTVTMSVWRSGCAMSTRAVVPHGGQADLCLSPVFSSFAWGVNGNNAMAFYDASSTGGQQVVNFWDFGDGGIDLSTDPSHFYAFPGAYDVSHSISTLDSTTLCMAGKVERLFVDGNTSTCDTSLFLSVTVNSFGGPNFFDASIVVFNDSLQLGSSMWEFGDGQVDLTSGPNTVHFYNDLGEYQACFTINAFNTQTQQACFAMACETILAAAVGVQEQGEEAQLRVWPIPFGDVLNVEGSAVVAGAGWALFDALGRLAAGGTVAGGAALQVNTSTLHSGPYVLIMRSTSHNAALRIAHE
jgi:PKD repeat protein